MLSPGSLKRRRVSRSETPVIVDVYSSLRANDGREIFLVRPLFYFFSRMRLKGPYLCPAHQHSDFEVILVTRGIYDCRLNGVALQIPANSALVVQPGDTHEDFCEPPLDYVGLRFALRQNASGETPHFFREGIVPTAQLTPLPKKIYLSLLDKITEETTQPDAIAAHIQDALLYEFFWRLVRAFNPSLIASWLLPNQPDERFQAQLYNCFAQNLARALTVPEMARHLGMSPRTLFERCQRLFGLSPAKVFLRFRISQARELLARTEMSVKEVSYRLGFSNPYHFSRAYKQVLGCPPSAEKSERSSP